MCIGCFPLSFTGQICFPTKPELLLCSLQHNYSQYFCILSLSLCVASFDIFHNIFRLSLAFWETEANHLSEFRPHKQKAESIAVKYISEQKLFNINILPFGSRHKKKKKFSSSCSFSSFSWGKKTQTKQKETPTNTVISVGGRKEHICVQDIRI